MERNLDLGQHFMIDEALLDSIISLAKISSDDDVLEIGLGEGVLTKRLVQTKANSITVVEKDDRLQTDLDVHILYGDILEKLPQLSFSILVANLPYQILEPLFILLLKKFPSRMVVVVSATFAQKIQEATILGSIYAEYYSIATIQTISRFSFSPPPRVESALLVLERISTHSQHAFREHFYSSQTKKVKNYMTFITQQRYTKRQIATLLETLPESLLNKRLYALSQEEFRILDLFYQQHIQ